MNKTDEGGPAFPWQNMGASGMTLRDWFAGQALAGIVATYQGAGNSSEKVAASAYACADAMIEVRRRLREAAGA